ncbi:MFS family permease [Mycetocola sp. BIGb0189]|uniref:MFS transporter n=1 Tax=Mycetocola sp. BIGb0189 TaxID=2940604 RepID=UPI0021698C02|nr:MFS transporter [Mycetocola sp. BIGb0189]MCS4277201.1 MFS family permease [Mycetocola sp. BIGb0189]
MNKHIVMDSAEGGAGASAERLNRGQRRLLGGLIRTNFSLFVVWGAVGLLLQAQVQELSPDNKEASYTLIASAGAIIALFISPIAGSVSDRTRSRFGRRTPWILMGSIGGGIGLLGIGSANTLVQVFLGWIVVQITLNFMGSALMAILPDQVPDKRRGLYASMLAVGMGIGLAAGQIFASMIVPNFLLAYAVVAGIVFLGAAFFVVLNPGKSNLDEPREPYRWRQMLSTFWVNPIRHPDFAWAFLGRFCLNLGAAITGVFTFFVLQDYIGLTHADALAAIPVLTLTALIFGVVTTALVGWISDRVSRRRIFVSVGAGLGAVGMLIPLITPTLTGMIIGAAIGGVSAGTFHAVDLALITQVLPSSNDYGKDLGVINIATTLPQSMAPIIAGVIVAFLGGYPGLYWCGLVILTIAAASVWRIRSVR